MLTFSVWMKLMHGTNPLLHHIHTSEQSAYILLLKRTDYEGCSKVTRSGLVRDLFTKLQTFEDCICFLIEKKI